MNTSNFHFSHGLLMMLCASLTACNDFEAAGVKTQEMGTPALSMTTPQQESELVDSSSTQEEVKETSQSSSATEGLSSASSGSAYTSSVNSIASSNLASSSSVRRRTPASTTSNQSQNSQTKTPVKQASTASAHTTGSTQTNQTTPQQTTNTPEQTTNGPEQMVNAFDMYRPVAYSVIRPNKADCESVASGLAGFAVTCQQNGTYFQAKFLSPIDSELRKKASSVAELYRNSELASPKHAAAARYLRQLYNVALKREPDVEGFYYWLNEYFGHNASAEPAKPLSFLSDSIINVSKDYAYAVYMQANWTTSYTAGADEFLRMLYLALLGREPDAEGLAWWKQELAQRTHTVEQVRMNFYTQSEYLKYTSGLGLPQ